MTKELKQLLDKNREVSFKCENSKDEELMVFKTYSTLNPPASDEELKTIENRLGEYAKEFIDFYQNYNGATFHHTDRIGESSIEVYSVDFWDTAMGWVNDWYKDLWDNDREEFEDRLDWLDDCVVFAEPTDSANYFIFALTGRYKGKVIFCDHDGLEVNVYAETFNQFLERYLSDPVKEMQYLELNTIYDDRVTDKQWMPIEEVE